MHDHDDAYPAIAERNTFRALIGTYSADKLLRMISAARELLPPGSFKRRALERELDRRLDS